MPPVETLRRWCKVVAVAAACSPGFCPEGQKSQQKSPTESLTVARERYHFHHVGDVLARGAGGGVSTQSCGLMEEEGVVSQNGLGEDNGQLQETIPGTPYGLGYFVTLGKH